jgi:CDGSH-type Zn-finger protein
VVQGFRLQREKVKSITTEVTELAQSFTEENFLLEDFVAVKITIRPNGPYRVEPADGIELIGADGTKYDLTGKPGISLCRCGGSVNKPFCDGTHSKIGFQGAELAVKKAEEGATS